MVRTFVAREGLARRPVLVSFLFQRLDLLGHGGDLIAEPEFAVGDTVTGATLGVEEVLEAGVLVGELGAFQAGLFRERDCVEPAR